MNLFEQTKVISHFSDAFYNYSLYLIRRSNNEKIVESIDNEEYKNNKILSSCSKMEKKEKEKEKNDNSVKDKNKINTEAKEIESVISHTPSYLDIFDTHSTVSESNFRGFCNLILNVIFFFAFIVPIKNFMDKGYFFDTELFYSMLKKSPLWILLWISNFLFTFTSYFIHYFYRKKCISSLTLMILHTPCEICVLIVTISSCFYIKFPVLSRGFLVAMCYIYVMKMHSYVYTNLDCEKKQPESYAAKCKNLSLKNYTMFILCPSLIYKFNFKRILKFRPKYFVQKIVCLLLTSVVEYITYTSFILPIIKEMDRMSYIETIIRLIFPCFIIFIASFYLIFECLCNILAEVTIYGERDFYQDWWNSTIWYEFSRKWNSIVQAWLHRHVYLAAKNNLKLKGFNACLFTYLFSAIFHEILMMVCFRSFKFYLFFLMFLQFPLSWLGERLYKNTTIGNIIFWSNILMGMPLIFICYANEIKHSL